jgi:hypothetical protein
MGLEREMGWVGEWIWEQGEVAEEEMRRGEKKGEM